MSELASIALPLILLMPLLAAVLTVAFGRILGYAAHWLTIGAGTLAFFGAVVVLSGMMQTDKHVIQFTGGTWFSAGDVNAQLTLAADPITAIMLLGITFIGTWIAVFSAGYMHHDKGYARYFGVMSLFIFCMLGLVLTTNFLVLYAFWEGVGLCSYLLIGYYHFKPSAAEAARKAFLVTRIGDVGLLLGIGLLWMATGSLEYSTVFSRALSEDQTLLTVACLLIFCGCVGKSAQFPLHVWLPDAMEGPTPVSALIHAATMVTAGVYLVARCTPIFLLAPAATLTVGVIGSLTALIAALIALTQFDLKRVLAYSTVSQLGYMFVALGCLSPENSHLTALAVGAAIFHLFTHAFFKALLFLSAGSVMHAMGDVIDMRRFGGLRKILPTTHWTFLIGAMALAGVPLLSGFFSKDMILEAVRDAMLESTYAKTTFAVMLFSGIATAGLTAFYTARAYFMTFWGPEVIPSEAEGHAHESPAIMTIPLMVLAVGAAFVGGLFSYFFFEDFTKLIEYSILVPSKEHIHHPYPYGVIIGSITVAFAGIGLAAGMYARGHGKALSTTGLAGLLADISRNRLYIDDLYDRFLVKPLSGIAVVLSFLDEVVHGLALFVASIPRMLGDWLRPLQTGLVQFYAVAMVMAFVVFVGYLAFSQAR